MGKKFCPKCGKTTENFFDKLCEECFLKNISFSGELPDKIVVRICKSCCKIFVVKKTASTVEKAVEMILSKFLEKSEVQSASYRISDGIIHVTLNIKIGDVVKSEEKEIKLVEKNILCEYCSMKSSKYYQSTLQLRAPENILEKIMDDIESQMNAINEYDNFAFISSLEKVRGGYDIFVGSKSSATQIAKNMKNKYRAEIKISSKLSGAINGKKAYKDTILISIK